MNFARMVQLGWVIGRADVDAPVEVKTALVRPDGYVISDKAAKFHGISQDKAMREGQCLDDVLRAFMADVLEACRCG
eukprot:7386678-Karenia_brevis.AAC.1